MDKSLVNHQIVSMRKTGQKAVRHVLQKQLHTIQLLKARIARAVAVGDAEADERKNKLKRKVKAKEDEIAKLKKLKVDQASKFALAADSNELEARLAMATTSVDDRLGLMVALTKVMQQEVSKFKVDNPGADQWLPVLLDLWDEKKEVVTKKVNKLKKKAEKFARKEKRVDRFEMATRMMVPDDRFRRSSQPKMVIGEKAIEDVRSHSFDDLPEQSSKQETKSRMINGKVIENENVHPMAVIKRINLNELSSSNILSADEVNITKMVKKEPIRRLRSDNFFLGDGEVPPPNSSEDKEDEEKPSLRPKKNLNKERDSFSTPNGRASNELSRGPKERNIKGKVVIEDTHPSWAARKLAKESQKISFDHLPKTNKRTTFD